MLCHIITYHIKDSCQVERALLEKAMQISGIPTNLIDHQMTPVNKLLAAFEIWKQSSERAQKIISAMGDILLRFEKCGKRENICGYRMYKSSGCRILKTKNMIRLNVENGEINFNFADMDVAAEIYNIYNSQAHRYIYSKYASKIIGMIITHATKGRRIDDHTYIVPPGGEVCQIELFAENLQIVSPDVQINILPVSISAAHKNILKCMVDTKS